LAQEFHGDHTWRKGLTRDNFVALVRRADELARAEMVRISWAYSVHMKQPTSTLKFDEIDELDREVTDEHWKHLFWADAICVGYRSEGYLAGNSLWLRVQTRRFRTEVSLNGDSRTEVEGIIAQLRELGDKLLAEQRRTEVTRRVRPLSRLMGSPWTVTIVGGLVVALVAGVVLAVVLGH
jgi:hypothetical protein